MKFARNPMKCRTAALVLVIFTLVAMPAWESGAGALAKVHPILPPHNPTKNFRLASANKVLASIDAARSSQEGLAPLSFDAARFARLSVAEQVFVVSNLERTTRGLYPAMAMVQRLDTIAAAAARHDEDPVDYGKGFSSIWSSAPASLGQAALFADFGWMYDDGPPPQYIFRNVDCVRAGDSGCWGHRDNILSDPLAGWSGCRSELVTGTGFAPRTADGPSLSQIFEVACTNVGGAAFTWSHAVSYLKIPSSESGLVKSAVRGR
jgi:hypothetical protein